MTLNDLKLNERNTEILRTSGYLNRLMRDGQKLTLRLAYWRIAKAAILGYFRTWTV